MKLIRPRTIKTKHQESLFNMSPKEKETIEMLKKIVREKYDLFCRASIRDYSYKTQEAATLYLKRRKATAFLRFAGVKELNGIVYAKKNFRLLQNATLCALVSHFRSHFVTVPDKELKSKNKYSKDFLKIFNFFIDAFLWKEVSENNLSYLIEYVIPALRFEQNRSFILSDFRKDDLIETRMNSYHFRPCGWTPDNSTLELPLLGVEIEFYHQNLSIFKNTSNFFYFQHDGSLNDERGGVELTTRPLPIDSLLKTGGGIDILCERFFPLFGAYSQTTKETGLHVHVSRLKPSLYVDLLIKKCFYSFPGDLIKTIFGRESNKYCCPLSGVAELNKYGIHPSLANKKGQELIFTEKTNRYCELNFNNPNTIEFRRGKGTVKKERIKTIIDFCYFTYLFALENSEKSTLTLQEIFPHYISYLREKCMTRELRNLLKKI